MDDKQLKEATIWLEQIAIAEEMRIRLLMRIHKKYPTATIVQDSIFCQVSDMAEFNDFVDEVLNDLIPEGKINTIV